MANPKDQTWPTQKHPRNLDGKKLVVRFAVDDRGNVLRVEFASTGDRSFDRYLRDVMMGWKFRPAFLRSTGTPVPSVYEAEWDF